MTTLSRRSLVVSGAAAAFTPLAPRHRVLAQPSTPTASSPPPAQEAGAPPATWRTWILTAPDELRPAAPAAPTRAEIDEVLLGKNVGDTIQLTDERGRLALSSSVDQWLDDLRALPEIGFQPLSFEIARKAGALGEPVPGDPADRIIVATAAVLGAKLVTADERLSKATGIQTIW